MESVAGGTRDGLGSWQMSEVCCVFILCIFICLYSHGRSFLCLSKFLVDKISLSKYKICITLRLFPDISIVLENICVIKISLVSELAVRKAL